MPKVEPRSLCERVNGHSPRFIRSASEAIFRLAARMSATVSSAGATGEGIPQDEGEHGEDCEDRQELTLVFAKDRERHETLGKMR